MRTSSAFTLIELLVVIAVIALLVGILLPSLRMARHAARSSKCLAQQNQIYLAIIAYANDYKDYHHQQRLNFGARFMRINPAAGFDPNNLRLLRPLDPNAYWGAIYDPYFNIEIDESWYAGRMPGPLLGGWEVWHCPDAKTMDPYPDGTVFDPEHLHQTYGFNGVDDRIDPDSGRSTGIWFKRVRRGNQWVSMPQTFNSVQLPAQVIFFQDAFEHMLDANGDTLNDLSQYDSEGGTPFAEWEHEYFRHFGGCNTVWGDGHAKSVAKPEWNETLPWYTGQYTP
jgi:prepilin-type N-terminal cleavage/methylation domain-containing protein/prepilin-type processing-associated H-X9-DG protein